MHVILFIQESPWVILQISQEYWGQMLMQDFRLTLNASLIEPITMGVVGSGKPFGPTSALGSVSAHSFAKSTGPSSKATDRPWKPGFSYSSQLKGQNRKHWQSCKLKCHEICHILNTRKWLLLPSSDDLYGDEWREFKRGGILYVTEHLVCLSSKIRLLVYNNLQERIFKHYKCVSLFLLAYLKYCKSR